VSIRTEKSQTWKLCPAGMKEMWQQGVTGLGADLGQQGESEGDEMSLF
jgi:hypothetical protein